MPRHLLALVVATLPVFCCSSPSEKPSNRDADAVESSLPTDTTESADAPADAAEADVADSLPADGPAPEEPDAVAPPAAPRALLLDFEMRHPVSWRFPIEQLAALGFDLQYRRWYPHVTAADLATAPGKPLLSLLLVSAGNSPSEPSERMRLDDVKNLVAYVQAGGILVLLVRNSWLDGYGGDSEWTLFNRILEELALPVRIGRNTAVGMSNAGIDGKPPHHKTTAVSYPGSLEWTLDWPVCYPETIHPAMARAPSPFPCGVTATLACDSDQAAILAATHKNVLLWHQLESSLAAVTAPLAPQPTALLVPAGGNHGFVAILPRSLLQLPVHTEYMSDKPVLDFDMLDEASTAGLAILKHLNDLRTDPSLHAPAGCHVLPDGPLFSVAADGLEPLSDGPVINALFPPSARPVPDQPPTPPTGAGPLDHNLPAGPQPLPSTTPAWFQAGRARVGYGGQRAYEEMLPFMQKAVAAGIDSFVVTIDPAWLQQPLDPDPNTWPFAPTSQAAANAGGHALLGVTFLTAKYGELAASIPPATGAYGQQLKAPAPLSDIYWNEAIRPMVLAAAKAAHLPDTLGICIDTELYGAGDLWYQQGFAFDPDSWSRILAAVATLSPDLAASLDALPPGERLPALVDAGLLRFAYQALEDETAARSAALLAEARAINPDVEIAFYSVVLPTGWFYRGLMRGFGTAEHPVVWLTYDIATNKAREVLDHEDIHVRILGGLLGVLFSPADLQTALFNAGDRSDGYWLFQFTDFPVTWDPANPPKMNGTPDEYWTAITDANEALDLAPPPFAR